MGTKTYAFSGGLDGIPGFGLEENLTFGGTWALGDTWRIDGVTSLGDRFTLGRGDLANVNSANMCMTLAKRMYLALASQFGGSDNLDPTRWEIQSPGAFLVDYLSNYGPGQDTVYGLGVIQGRLVVFGRRSIEIWTIDADPNNFALVQTLDNIGTKANESIRQLGDYDLLFLDDTGVRSLRSKEVTLNAYVDDAGTPVDDLVRADLKVVDAITSCSIVDPETKNYWLFINAKIYVLARHPTLKISAWATYLPTDQTGSAFTPVRFVVFNGQVYCRGAERGHYVYGGANNTTYDAQTVVTVQLPWLHDKRPDTLKVATDLSAVLAGSWQVKLSMDPQSNAFTVVIPTRGTPTAPNELTDSTYDLGNYRVPGMKGTHFSIQAISTPGAATSPAVLSRLVLHYNEAGKA